MASLPDAIPTSPSPGRPIGSSGQGGVTYQLGTHSEATEARHLILIDQMIAWQVANPGKPWTLCAQALGLTPIWCRMVASTDAFKARYNEVKDSIIKEIGLLGLREKIAAAAEIAVERLAEKASVCESMGDLTDAAEMLLKQHYGDKGAPAGAPSGLSITVNQTILDARERIMSGSVAVPIPQDSPPPPLGVVVPCESLPPSHSP